MEATKMELSESDEELYKIKIHVENEAWTFEEAISMTDYGWYNVMVFLISGFNFFSAIIESLVMSFIIPAAQCDLNLTLKEKGLLASVGSLGIVMSCLLWGVIADAIGRRKLLVITSYISLAAGVASSLAPNASLLIILRLINSFFITCSSVVGVVYLGEFHSNSYRARVISLSGLFIGLGGIFVPCVSWLILPMKWSFSLPFLDITVLPWRLLIIVNGLSTFISATGLYFLPESPKYLWSVGKSDEAVMILNNIYRWNTGRPQSTYKVKYLIDCDETAEVNKENSKSLKSINIYELFVNMIRMQLMPIFQYPLLYKTIITCLLQFGILASFSGFGVWFPDLINKVAHYVEENPTKSMIICDALEYYKLNKTETVKEQTADDCLNVINKDVFIINIITGVILFLETTFVGYIIKHMNKRFLLAILLAVSGTAGIIMNFMQSYVLITLVGATISFGISASVTLNSFIVDSFPTKSRSSALAAGTVSGRLGALMGIQIIGFLYQYACNIAFYSIGIDYLGLAFASFLVPNTRIM